MCNRHGQPFIASFWYLAPGRTVEDHPNGEILAEVLEMVVGSRGDEEAIAWLERFSLAVVEQDALTAYDDVDLILFVRRLPVRAQGASEFHVDSTAP
jgi:hypothetical protein